jgi:hypothetical protein
MFQKRMVQEASPREAIGVKFRRGVAEWYGWYVETFLGTIPIFGWVYFHKIPPKK